MREFVTRGTTALVGLVVVAVFLGHLLASDAILVVRDVPIFHVPLRSAFATLAGHGLPVWNPSIHAGQPILSNPNYAAFYPPTWLALLMPAHRAVSWILVLHGVFAFAGAWLAARRFGCGRAAATLTGVAFLAGGAMLSSANGVTTFCSASWLPWTLYWSRRYLDRPESPLASLRTALPGFGLAMQVLAGEPAIALASSVAVACLVLTARGTWIRRVRSLAVIAAFAALLGAVQLLPTLAHVGSSSRSGKAVAETATWSTPPLRLFELAVPRLYGDPMGLDEDRYFGWKLHDRDFPYLISIYGGQLVLILALAAFLRWPIRHRGFWITLALVGLALAFGRHNPLYQRLASSLPLLGLVRYPEKFILLTTTALAFGAGLGWQHLLDKRRHPGPAREDFAIALSSVIALVMLLLCLTLTARPEVGNWFVTQNTHHPPTGERLATAAAFLTRQAWIGLGSIGAALVVLSLHRVRRTPTVWLVALTLLCLTADLAYYNRGLTPTISYSELSSPPDHLRSIDPAGGRVFTDEPFVGREGFQPRTPRPGPDALWSKFDRAEPYLGLLWGYSYALHLDFDLMLTEPAARALDLLRERWGDEAGVRRILSSWGVRYVLRNRSVTELTSAALAGQKLPAVEVETLAWRSPLLTWERQVTWHETAADAERAAAEDKSRSAHWIGSPSLGHNSGGAPDTISRLEAKSSSTLLEYSSSTQLLAVLNTTFDRGWRAVLDDRVIPVHRTVLGQIGLELPAGDHVVDLRFETPYLRAGSALTVLGLLAVLGGEWVRRRSRGEPSG